MFPPDPANGDEGVGEEGPVSRKKFKKRKKEEKKREKKKRKGKDKEKEIIFLFDLFPC